MKARTLGVAPTIPAVIAVEVVVVAGLVLFPPARASWWPAAGIAVAAIAALLVTVHRRSAVGWLAALVRFWRRRRRGPVAIPAAVDIPHGSQLYGVRVAGDEAITMIAVSGQAYSPTVLTGAATALTPNLLPLDELTALLDQPGGIRLAGIDIVSSGVRVRRGIGYPPLYSTLLADRPAAGQRSTRLVVRLDIARSTEGLQFRASVGAAAAAATERIVNALLQRDVRANALTAKDSRRRTHRTRRRPRHTRDTPRRRCGRCGFVGTGTHAHRGVEVGACLSRFPDVVLLFAGGREHQRVEPDVGAALRRGGADGLVEQEAQPHRRGATGSSAGASVRPPATDESANALPEYAPGRPGTCGGAWRPRQTLVRSNTLSSLGRGGIGDSGRVVGNAGGDDAARRLAADGADRSVPVDTDQHAHVDGIHPSVVGKGSSGRRTYRDLHRQPDPVDDARAATDRGCRPESPPEFVPSIIVSDRAVGPPPAGLASTVISLGEVRNATRHPDISFTQTSESRGAHRHRRLQRRRAHRDVQGRTALPGPGSRRDGPLRTPMTSPNDQRRAFDAAIETYRSGDTLRRTVRVCRDHGRDTPACPTPGWAESRAATTTSRYWRRARELAVAVPRDPSDRAGRRRPACADRRAAVRDDAGMVARHDRAGVCDRADQRASTSTLRSVFWRIRSSPATRWRRSGASSSLLPHTTSRSGGRTCLWRRRSRRHRTPPT